MTVQKPFICDSPAQGRPLFQIPHCLRYSQEQPSWPHWPPPANSPFRIPHSKFLTACATRRNNPHGCSGLHPPIPHFTFRTPNSSLPALLAGATLMAALASTRQFPTSHSALQIPNSLRYSQEQPSRPHWPPPANSPFHIPHSKFLTPRPAPARCGGCASPAPAAVAPRRCASGSSCRRKSASPPPIPSRWPPCLPASPPRCAAA